MRQFSFVDKLLIAVDGALNTVLANQPSSRPNPADQVLDTALSATAQRDSQGFMRVNHAGEVCAQALYRGQLAFVAAGATRQMLEQAAIEETDHLTWTHQRLQELGTHRSYLNFFWYANAFAMGVLASYLGDAWSLGFVEETERQVTRHLEGHLQRLAPEDQRSRAIVDQMRRDEMHHGAQAQAAGARQLPRIVSGLMRLHAKVMTSLAYYL